MNSLTFLQCVVATSSISHILAISIRAIWGACWQLRFRDTLAGLSQSLLRWAHFHHERKHRTNQNSGTLYITPGYFPPDEYLTSTCRESQGPENKKTEKSSYTHEAEGDRMTKSMWVLEQNETLMEKLINSKTSLSSVNSNAGTVICFDQVLR